MDRNWKDIIEAYQTCRARIDQISDLLEFGYPEMIDIEGDVLAISWMNSEGYQDEERIPVAYLWMEDGDVLAAFKAAKEKAREEEALKDARAALARAKARAETAAQAAEWAVQEAQKRLDALLSTQE